MEIGQYFWAENSVSASEPCISESMKKCSNGSNINAMDGRFVHKNISSVSEESEDFCNHSESFKALVEKGVPWNYESVEEKLVWLRSQIIGEEAEFDSVFGRRRLVYADHTASGRSLLYNENFIINHVLPYYGNTHTCDSYVGSRTTKMLHEATQYIKMCLGSGQDDALLFCGSGTTAAIKRLQQVMAIAVPSILRDTLLKTLTTQERWVVFVGPHEHHSNLLSWRQSLAQVIEIGLDDQGLLDMDSLKQHLETYKHTSRPILGSFSACSNITGIFSDTRAIAQLLHQYNGFACFDFAASGPYVEIDMRSGESDGYDAVFLSPHKFLGGPASPGVLLMNRALYQLRSSPPSTCGGGTVSYVNGFNEKDTIYLESIEERENGGTPQIIQTVRAALAFWVKEYIGLEEIEKREQLYINKALERLLPNPNIEVLGNVNVKRQAILSFLVYSTTNSSSSTCGGNEMNEEEGELNLWTEIGNKRGKPLHGPFVAALLNDLFGIQARGGCACAGPYGHELLNIDKCGSLAIRSAIQEGYVGVKPGWTRVSFPYYMSEEDFEFILSAIEFVAKYGQRFLPLYSFNLRNGSWRVKIEEVEELVFEEDSYKIPIHFLEQFGIARRNASYLDTAKCIASRLPKFPTQSILTGNIDPHFLHFRV
ncbi:putative cysteine desulfurase [Senna tora]|uniref:Putative cysteine desulfurase n=1 Tax=Senna tora TaxID=362788 RepID=A0A834WXJ5_9FABA|nr:putative cysteine desulfurase [Senna tora]